MQLSTAPWNYSPEDISTIVEEATAKKKFIVDPQCPKDAEKRPYLVRGKQSFTVTDGTLDEWGAVGHVAMDGNLASMLLGADGVLSPNMTPALPGLSEAAFASTAFGGEEAPGKSKKEKTPPALANKQVPETPAGTALLKINHWLELASVADKYKMIMETHQLSDTLPAKLGTFANTLRRQYKKVSNMVHSPNVDQFAAEDYLRVR